MGKDRNSKKNPRASNKTQKVPEPKINPPKNPVRNFRALIIAKCNVVHIKQLQNKFGLLVWLYFIRRTTPLGYAGTTTNPQLVLYTPQKPYLI